MHPRRRRGAIQATREHGDQRPHRSRDRRSRDAVGARRGRSASSRARSGSRSSSSCSAILNAIALWAVGDPLRGRQVGRGARLVAATLAIDAVYLIPDRRLVPLKFLVPGTVFLLAFQSHPDRLERQHRVHQLVDAATSSRKDEAIAAIEEQLARAAAGRRAYVMAPPATSDGELVLLLVDEDHGDVFVGTKDGLEPARMRSRVHGRERRDRRRAEGYDVIQGDRALHARPRARRRYTVPTSGDASIRPEGSTSPRARSRRSLRPGERHVHATSRRHRLPDNGKGSFDRRGRRASSSPAGRRTSVSQNFNDVLTDPLVRDPFVRVFLWTFVFAFLSVLIRSRSASSSRSCSNKPGLQLPAHPPRRCSCSRSRSRRSSRCSSGRGS